MKRVLNIIIIIVLLFMSGCTNNSEMNIFVETNLNSHEPFFISNDNIYYVKRDSEESTLISHNIDTDETKAILEAEFINAVYVCDDSLLYAEDNQERTKRTIFDLNLKNGEKKEAFSVEFVYNEAVQAPFIKKSNEKIMYFDGNDLWVYDGENVEKAIKDITGICFNGNDIYYSNKNGDLYYNNTDFTNEYCVLNLSAIYNHREYIDYLDFLGGLGVIRNIAYNEGNLYFILSDKSRNGIILSYDINNNDLKAYHEKFRAESFQLVRNEIYAYGFSIDDDKALREYYRITEKSCQKISDNINQNYNKDFLVSEDALYSLGDDYKLQKLDL